MKNKLKTNNVFGRIWASFIHYFKLIKIKKFCFINTIQFNSILCVTFCRSSYRSPDADNSFDSDGKDIIFIVYL